MIIWKIRFILAEIDLLSKKLLKYVGVNYGGIQIFITK